MQRFALTFKLKPATAASNTRARFDTHSVLLLLLRLLLVVGVGVATPPFDVAAIAVYVLATLSTRLSARSCLTSCTPQKKTKENTQNK